MLDAKDDFVEVGEDAHSAQGTKDPAVDVEVGKVDGVVFFRGDLVGSCIGWINGLRPQNCSEGNLTSPFAFFGTKRTHARLGGYGGSSGMYR